MTRWLLAVTAAALGLALATPVAPTAPAGGAQIAKCKKKGKKKRGKKKHGKKRKRCRKPAPITPTPTGFVRVSMTGYVVETDEWVATFLRSRDGSNKTCRESNNPSTGAFPTSGPWQSDAFSPPLEPQASNWFHFEPPVPSYTDLRGCDPGQYEILLRQGYSDPDGWRTQRQNVDIVEGQSTIVTFPYYPDPDTFPR